ncbi:MAG: Eukaryotic translation initiation factor eIF2A [Bacteroidota bacterium]|jgi:Tol biopolymer transport system component
MKPSIKTKSTLEMLLVIGLILIIPLFFAINSRANTPETQAEFSPIPPTVAVNAPEDSNAVKPKQPPACTFPLAGTTTEESTPEEYTFSEPQVVLTSEYDPDIIEWLPDNQNVLIMPTNIQSFNGVDGYLQTIELFNPETQETQIYATRRDFGDVDPPTWSSALNAIIYPAPNVLGKDNKTRQIRISYGNPDETQIIADHLPQYYVTVNSDGSQIAYLTDKKLIKLDASLNLLPPVSFDRKLQDYKRKNTDDVNVIYKMAWRPNSSQIFVYNWAPDNLGYTYILDADTGSLCNLNFDGWALVTRWSPNGRYLAIIRAQGRVPLQASDLVVLDTATGNLYTLGVPQEIEGRHILKDIAWAPDNRHLFFVGSKSDYSGMLFLGDFISGEIIHIFPSYKFKPVEVGVGLAWSPDGSKLLMNCRTLEETARVCLISVQTGGQ